jgi:hypothetical protein
MDPAAGDIRRLQKMQKVSGSHPRPPEACFPPDRMNDTNQQVWRIRAEQPWFTFIILPARIPYVSLLRAEAGSAEAPLQQIPSS